MIVCNQIQLPQKIIAVSWGIYHTEALSVIIQTTL